VFGALGRFTYRFRRWIPPAAVALLIGINLLASSAGGTLIQGGWQIPDSEAMRAEALLADRFGEQATSLLVIYRDPAGDARSAAFAQAVADSVAPLAEDPSVTEILTFATTGDPKFVSTDGTWTFALVRLADQVEAAVDDASRLAGAVVRPVGVELYVSGVPIIYHEYNQKIEGDLVLAEAVSLPIALLILLVVFGSLVGATLPLLIALLSLGTTFAAIQVVAGFTEMSIFVNNLASMIGLALSIDYALFMVSRFREELRHHSVEVAVERMMATVGKAVAISGVAVAIGLSCLVVFEAVALRSMGLAGITTVLVTLVFALTVLPAVLGMLGPRVNRLRIPLPRFLRVIEADADAAEARHGRGVWMWVARRVMRRPFLIGGPALLALLLLGVPFLGLQLSTGGNLQDLPQMPSRTGFEILQAEFPGGDTDPIVLAVTYPQSDLLVDGIPADRLAALQAYEADLESMSHVASVSSVLDAPQGVPADQYLALLSAPAAARPPALGAWIGQWLAGDTAKLQVFSSELPDSEPGRALVADIRDLVPPDGATVLTSGLSSQSLDFITSFDASVPVAVLIVIGVTAGVLFLTFGSVFLPLKAVLMSLISISASFGALVWVFQDGNLAGPLGFEPSGATAAWLPVLMFAMLFGLSMDYEVFLLSRIRERYLATGDNTLAVAEGIGITGGIITGAALIMVAVFGAFALSSITFLKALGMTQALAVLIDATVVRGLLVPAFMRIMGWVNWWAPRWMQRAVARLGLYEGPASA